MIYSHALWFCMPWATAMQTCFMSSAFWWSVGVPCYLLNSWDVNAFNLQTLQCFAAQLVMVCCVTADSPLNKKSVKRTTLSMAVTMTVIVKQAKWQGPAGCIKPEAMPSLHVKHAMCGLSNKPSEGKWRIFCNHLWLVVSPLKSVHFMQACLSVRLWAKTNHILTNKCILSLVACYTLRHKTAATNVDCCLSNIREDLGAERT